MLQVAVLSFPGNNCEVETIRALRRAGMRPHFFRWNSDVQELRNADGYVLPGGFSYEDRGRSGMVAARDPVMDVIREEAAGGKPVIGICNGAQVLVESGLIPLGEGLRMSLAHNAIGEHAPGFLNEWVWMQPTCDRQRCATSDWQGPMYLPIAHGEGRFTTRDVGLMEELRQNGQIAFSYCDEEGNVSEDPSVTPNGSLYAIAGICNPEGNVVALMPHPERSPEGLPYFASFKRWMERRASGSGNAVTHRAAQQAPAAPELPLRSARPLEIFIDTIITNNEERTVEQAARRVAPSITLRQLKYFAPASGDGRNILQSFALFNPNKEVAYIRRGSSVALWNADAGQEEPADDIFAHATALLRRDEPDTGSAAIGGGETGVCYVCSNVPEAALRDQCLREILANPHASTLEILP
ncbi:phosphoribosylformylglycinamidine synthase I [Candidatus Peribacteria bacterium]|nr:phosphoribosylformylglycinamidine synthase I [Candidatus Peribacteria bacterium]